MLKVHRQWRLPISWAIQLAVVRCIVEVDIVRVKNMDCKIVKLNETVIAP